MERIQCRNCGAIHERPKGTLAHYHCTRCGARDLLPLQALKQPANAAVVGATVGAVLGAVVGGPSGAILGGLIGFLIGAKVSRLRALRDVRPSTV